MDTVAVKSIQLPPSLSDGLRVYVERRWPRNLTETTANVDLWLPEAAFTPELAQWIARHPQHIVALRKRYFAMLREANVDAALERLYRLAARRQTVTLLHAGKTGDNSAAALLKTLLEGRSKPPSPTGPARAAAVGLRASRSRPRRR